MAILNPMVFIFAGGEGTRMGCPTKCLLDVDPNNPAPFQKTSLGRVMAQLQEVEISEVYIFANQNESALKRFIEENKANLSIKVNFLREPKETNWKGVYDRMFSMLSKSQSAVILNADVVYRTSTVKRTVQLAREGKVAFRPIFGREVFTREKRKPVFGWSALVVRKDGFKLLPNEQIGDWFALKQGFRIGRVTYSRPFINLNTREDLKKARQILQRRRWHVR